MSAKRTLMNRPCPAPLLFAILEADLAKAKRTYSTMMDRAARLGSMSVDEEKGARQIIDHLQRARYGEAQIVLKTT